MQDRQAFALFGLLFALACSSPPAPTWRPQARGGAGLSSGGGTGQAGVPAMGGAGGGAGLASSSSAGSISGGGAGADTSGSFSWPNGALAAVTLTYDDGLDSHLALVRPALEARGLSGTFFLSNFEGVDHEWALPNLVAPLNARHMAWQALAGAGHELASHTVNHPCNDPGKADNFRLADYDMRRMGAELDDSAARLARLGTTAPLTFAYPCSSDEQGIGPAGEDYSPLVAARFLAARVSTSGTADPRTLDLLRVPQRDAGAKSAQELRAMVDEAIAEGTWLVLLFHGVGAEAGCANLDYDPGVCTINYLVTAEAAHDSLVAYLQERSAEVWSATFRQVAERIEASRR